MRLLIYAAIVYNAINHIIGFLVSIFVCLPNRTFWRCAANVSTIVLVTSAMNLFGDVFLLIVPFVGIAGLQSRLQRKLAVGVVFLTGLL